MKIIRTNEIDPKALSEWERDQCYNGLDAAVTYEVLDAILPQLDNHTSPTYDFSRALQGPCLEMRLRGVKIDQRRRAEVIDEYFEKLDFLETNLERIVREGLGIVGFNWRSNAHLQQVFYDELGIPVIRKQGRPTVNRDALEKLDGYIIARPITAHLVAMRDLIKKIQVLRTEIDPDGRIRTSYNIAGTSTGRLSSSFSEFGTGGNLQNIEESLRSVLVADKGMKLGHFDAQQIQSRIVGAIEWNLFHDGLYLDACESGDLHTTVSKLCEPNYGWTGELKHDKDLAENKLYYRHYSLRKLCKSIGHGSNFMGGPKTLNMQYKVDTAAIEKFQQRYFAAFPAHMRWWAEYEYLLKSFGYIISLTGRKRYFFGRRNDPETLRESLAFEGQAGEAHIVNKGMLQVWRQRICHLLMQGHDSITVQYPEEQEDELVPEIFQLLNCPVELEHDRTLVIPYGCKTGWNCGIWSKTNPDGLKEYSPGDKRKRSKEVHVLDRKFR